jgi:hypothetical protein
MSYETQDSQKEEFRKYLEKSGVISQLTRVLVGLYEEADKPTQAIDYVKKHLGAPSGIDIEDIKSENEELKKRNADLQKQVDSALAQIEALKKEQQ